MQFAVFNWCNETEPARHEIKVWHTLTPDLIHNAILALRAAFEPVIIRYLDHYSSRMLITASCWVFSKNSYFILIYSFLLRSSNFFFVYCLRLKLKGPSQLRPVLFLFTYKNLSKGRKSLAPVKLLKII